ncbi:MAG TPA: S-methyl-5-thioribose-1-phosphate isomerase [Candidatus Limnocylindria bacterium]|nr:S-methyl-5-thioribose-1-phosphate isomerase [Candidatus Limnocylindria bacterium]
MSRTIDWDGRDILIIDQTRLPHEEGTLRLHRVEELAEAITRLRVRGAPALGVAGALGLALAVRRAQEAGQDIGSAVDAAAGTLAATRPTATNLRWGINQARELLTAGPEAVVQRAVQLLEADVAINRALAQRGADLLGEREADLGRSLRLLTHCNTGSLACVEWGTALGIIRAAHERGGVADVLVTETRPLLQGARLTTWELERLGIPYRVVVDGAAPALIQWGRVDAVVVGADRVAANGDVANKIGTFSLALAARHAAIPFIVAAPESTLDPATATGLDIPIEERPEDEILSVNGHRVAPAGARALNPAFDVTPAGLITAIVTERRVIRPALGEGVVG